MSWYKKSQDYSKLSKEELSQYEFSAAEWGHSITPKRAFEKRNEGGFETLADLASYSDQWRFYNALGKGWEGHWEGRVRPSLHLTGKIKNGDKITIYRASDTGGILPGAYVTESKEYAIFHGETSMGGKYKIYQLDVYPDELMAYDDPHEFIYVPRNLDVAHERLEGQMNWYKLAQENLHIEQEDLIDRTRIYLMLGNKQVGKLTLQFYPNDLYPNDNNYYITAFKIDPEYRGKGWGTKMMERIVNDPKFKDRPIMLHPEPYGGEIGTQEYNDIIAKLKNMYKKMGFEELKKDQNWMRYKRNELV